MGAPSKIMKTQERLRLLDKSIVARLRRVKAKTLPIIQASVAGGIAYLAAQHIANHQTPFFAPITVVIILGLSGGDRIKRALDMSLGCVIGVAVGDLLVQVLGAGAWQMSVIVGASLLVASFFSGSALVSNQVAIGAILIATILPPGAATTGLDRTIDALIGSAIGLLTVALIPSDPLRDARQELSNVMGIVSSVIGDTAQSIRDHDAQRIEEVLVSVRGTQAAINAMIGAAKGSREATRLSPLMWGSRRNVRSLEAVLPAVDNALRNTRVLARRALVLVQDRDVVTEEQLEILDEISDIANDLSELFGARSGQSNDATKIPELVRRLRVLGAHADMSVLDDDAVLSAYVILAQSRSLITDLLGVCGMSRESAVAILAPTSTHPAFPSEANRWLED